MSTPVSLAYLNPEDIYALPENLVVQPTHPVGVFIQEAKNLEEWIQADIPLLISKGLEQSYINYLPKSITLCSQVQAKWLSELKNNRKTIKDENRKVANYLQYSNELLHDFHYAFRHSPDLLLALNNIEYGIAKSRIAQRLNDLAVLGRSQNELLQKINFDTTKLEQAAEYSVELANLIATSKANTNQRNKAQELRNRAYSQLKILVAEIRSCGRFVFWQTPDRLTGYLSEYNRKQYLKLKSRKKKIDIKPSND